MSRAICLANWPDAINGDYNPHCCRFPKSCSIAPPDAPATVEPLSPQICPLPTFGGETATEHHGHDGWPVSDQKILKAVKEGRKPYTPTHPVSIDQRPYREFAAKRGKNSE